MSTKAIALGYIALLTFLSSGLAGEERELRERFLSEAPKAWKELAALSERCELTAIVTDARFLREEDGAVRSQQTHIEFRFRSKGSWFAFERKASGADDGHVGEEVMCVGPEHAFVLRRETQSRPFQISFVDSVGSEAIKDIEQVVSVRFDPYLNAATSLLEKPLYDVIGSDYFTLLNIEEVIKDSEKFVRIEFSYDQDESSPDWNVTGGWLLLKPAELWSIREYECSTLWEPNGRLVGRLEYSSAQGGLPILASIDERQVIDIGERHIKCLFKEFEIRDVADSAFTLTAFGVQPVPLADRVSDRGAWLARLLIANGVLLGALAAFLVFRRVRSFRTKQ